MCMYLFGIEKSKKNNNISKIMPKSKPRYQDAVDNTSEHIPATPESKSKFLFKNYIIDNLRVISKNKEKRLKYGNKLIPFESKLYEDVQVNSAEEISNLYIPEYSNKDHSPAAVGKLL
jgi:hypothetical protein